MAVFNSKGCFGNQEKVMDPRQLYSGITNCRYTNTRLRYDSLYASQTNFLPV